MRNPLTRGRFTYNLGKAGANTPPPATITGSEEPPASPPPAVKAAPAAPPQKNRKQRRKDALFNRLLARRLERDKVPVKLEVLPDGGLHVTADMREEKP